MYIVPTCMFQYDCYLSCSCLCSISLLVSEPEATGVEKTLRTVWVVDEREEERVRRGERVRGTEGREGITVGHLGHEWTNHYQIETWLTGSRTSHCFALP